MFGRKDTGELRNGDKVIAVKPLKYIPDGTLGVVKMVIGQAWTRYLVEWEDGRWTGSVDGAQIVRRDRIEAYRKAEAAAASRTAATPAQTAATTPSSGGGGDDEDGGRIPEHLLERSRAARARAEAKASA